MKIKKGTFVRCQDIYVGFYAYGPFIGSSIAEEFAIIRRKDSPGWDEVEVIERDYIEIDGDIYPLCDETKAISPLTK